MIEHQSKQQLLLGTAIQITTVISVPTATSAHVKIIDPSNFVKVTAGVMTKETDKVYSYVYQSAATDVEGDYIVTFSIVYNGYTTVYQDKFTLVYQEPAGVVL